MLDTFPGIAKLGIKQGMMFYIMYMKLEGYDSNKLYAFLTYFNILSLSVFTLKTGISSLVESKASMIRLTNFLRSPAEFTPIETQADENVVI